MVSKLFFVAIFSIILPYSLAFSAYEAELGGSKRDYENHSIRLYDLLVYFLDLRPIYLSVQVYDMFFVATYGDRYYAISDADLSPECWRTAAAISLIIKNFTSEETLYDNVFVTLHKLDRMYLMREQKHPVEVACAAIEKEYAKNSNLSAIFEKVKKNVAHVQQNSSHRPPYFRHLIWRQDETYNKSMALLDVPEYAKLYACMRFQNMLTSKNPNIPKRALLFVRSCQAVSKDEKFAVSMQKIYEKAIDDVLPQIMVGDRYEKFITVNSKWAWFLHSLVKNFYGYVAKDPVLMKEVRDKAAIIDRDASKEDLDFSKI